MSTPQTKLFDDRWLMAIGIPVISLIVVIFFIKQTPQSVGWNYFLATWCISALYTLTYWTLSRWIIIYWRKHTPSIHQAIKRVSLTIISLILVVLIVELICVYIAGWEDLFRTVDRNLQSIFATGPVSVILVITMTGVYEAIYFFKLYRIAELDKERILRSQVENQLYSLRKQVDPHFLFNSLNTLVTIIPEDPIAAQEFTQRLSATYRRLLEWGHVGRATIKQELEALDDYLHLLEVRFEERLHVEIRIDPALSEYYIAALALQQLVENAVKHNEASANHPLIINIYSEGNSITVTNKKRLKPRIEIDSTRFGLENLRDRVRFLNEQELIIVETDEAFSVTVPLLEFAPSAKLTSLITEN